MNNRGFTLIELIMVIAILALLSIILIPVSGNIIEKGKINNCEDTIDGVIAAAKLYVADNRYELTDNDIELSTLVSEGYLKKMPDISSENENVRITYDENKKDYNISWIDKSVCEQLIKN